MNPYSNPVLTHDLKTLTQLPQELQEEGFQLHAYHNTATKQIKIEYIHIPIEYRRHNYATNLIKQILTLADEYNTQITIEPSNEFGTPTETLQKIYTKWGFRTQPNTTQMIYP